MTLKSIRAKVLLMPSKTDPLFKVCYLDTRSSFVNVKMQVEDSRMEASLLPHGELQVIDSLWGHFGEC